MMLSTEDVATVRNMEALIESFHDKELVVVNGHKFVINALTEQMPATPPSLLHEAARQICAVGDFTRVNKVVGEEDKGAVLVAAVSLQSRLPFGLARWYPSGLRGQTVVDFACEYLPNGKLFLNGVEPGDRVVIADDVISTGGTMVSLIRAIERSGATVVDVICVAEKVEYGGCARVKAETGHEVKSILKISVSGQRSRVLPLEE